MLCNSFKEFITAPKIREKQFLRNLEYDENPKTHEHNVKSFLKVGTIGTFGRMSSLISIEKNHKPKPNCFRFLIFYCEQPH